MQHAQMEQAGDRAPGGTAGFALDRPAPLLSAGIIHDLGNLIQVASSALNRAERDPGLAMAPSLEPVLGSARTALMRAGAIVRETIRRADDSAQVHERADVGACLAEVATFTQSAWGPGTRLEFRIARDLPPVHCDQLGLQSAVLNLVLNARDAMPDGGFIAIDVDTVEGPVPCVELRIRDGGIGMSAETVLRAFDPFFTTKGKGLGGLGLPMVKQLAVQHGGSVHIDSALGAGTTVTLRLRAIERTGE